MHKASAEKVDRPYQPITSMPAGAIYPLRSTHWTYILVAGCVLLFLSCQPVGLESGPALTAAEVDLVQQLNQVVLPLQDADPTRELTELAPLDSLFSQAQLVGLGEATHGTREFFQMKHRLFRYLVERHGYRTLAFEDSFGSCVEVNRYIQGQASSIRTATDAVKRMGYWAWRTTEVRELIEWMKQYNTNKPTSEQLSFYGFDCQTYGDNYALISKFVAQVDLEASNQLPSVRVGDMQSLFEANEREWVAAGGRLNYEIAKHAVRVLIQQEDLTTNGICQRDQYMAENCQWLIDTLQVGKVAVWAHNHHIGNWSAYCGLPMMGAYLKQQFKQQYLAVGTSLSDGSFNAFGTRIARSPEVFSVKSQSNRGSFNYLLSRVQYATFAFNLTQPVLSNALLNWVSEEHPLFEPGALYDTSQRDDYYYAPSRLKGRYDLMIHFRHTTPSQLLP